MNGIASVVHECEISAVRQALRLSRKPVACEGSPLEVSLFYSNRLRENGGFEYATSEAIFEASKGSAPRVGRSWLDLFDGRRRVGSGCTSE
jgi:hypothetical protein